MVSPAGTPLPQAAHSPDRSTRPPSAGPAFLGAFRMTTALATPGQRAGLVTAIFIVTYLALSVPALIAGVASTTFGLHSTALVCTASLAALAAVAASIGRVRVG
jgi:hypothetical protein